MNALRPTLSKTHVPEKREHAASLMRFLIEAPVIHPDEWDNLPRETRDHLLAIGDLGFDLAVAELRANQPDAALKTARGAVTSLGCPAEMFR